MFIISLLQIYAIFHKIARVNTEKTRKKHLKHKKAEKHPAQTLLSRVIIFRSIEIHLFQIIQAVQRILRQAVFQFAIVTQFHQ